MKEKIQELLGELSQVNIADAEALEHYRLTYLSKKGALSQLFDEFKHVPNDQKKEVGQLLNQLKQKAQEIFDQNQEKFSAGDDASVEGDITLPAPVLPLGSKHPVTITMEDMSKAFEKLGFSLTSGPEIEDDWHNFSALNFPQNHPARDMQDTFFVEKDFALRTHTTSVQVRVLENQKPPVRVIFPGRVYRNEAVSARANCFFHQVDGVYIDKNVSFADLKQTMYFFVQEMFGNDTKVRFRPSYFPFTEPSAEMDMTCFLCGGKGCNVCKYSGWVEILGCGMVHPNVLRNCNIDPEEYSGFAFGIGVDRVAMLRFDVNDLRTFYENDTRFLKQFSRC